ncbi:MAG: twin-arginine translocase TatA/TatE family subunit [Bdellovibrionales bacterium]|nr:twin-arginine translocase TatA/TatE family subunit [Bdellovibrionales bacterium]
MFGLGAGELLLIFVIAILFLGPKKIPELAKGLGQAMREFQKARDDMMNEINKPHPDTTAANAEAQKKADVEVIAVKVEETPKASSESPKQS